MSKLIFCEEDHTYMLDGRLIPSVSKLVGYALGDEYPNVPKSVLKRAAERGTLAHNAIQAFIELVIGEGFTCEEMIDFNGLMAGRYDILQELPDKTYRLIDIKTNSKYPKEHLEWQMGLYSLGIQKEITEFKCLWIPSRGKPKFLDVVPHTKEECVELISRYTQEKESEIIDFS